MATLADIVRGEAARYLDARFVTPEQDKALRAIAGCRTAAMGAVTIPCDRCQADCSMYRSCRNRSCPQCGGTARAKWVEGRMAEILPVPYSHVVFTPPAELDELALRHPREFYGAMMRAAGQAVVDVGRSELHLALGCEVHLHTWGDDMPLHPHAHCMVPCGGFAEDGQWVSFRPQDLPVDALSRRFRALLCRAMRTAARNGELKSVPQVEQMLAAAEGRPWRVYSQPPFGGPEQLLRYLARYMYRVAITNDRIVSYENHKVTFRRRECGRSTTKALCILDAQEFLRRFVLHVLPKGFVRVRSYGFMANHNRKRNNERARERIGNAEMPRQREPFRVLCLCPACYEAWSKDRTPPFAVRLDLAAQTTLTPRPPPADTVAA